MPVAPPAEVSLEVVPDAVVTAVKRGDLRTDHPPRRWMTGAVHRADGSLVVGSQRRWNGEAKAPVPADPDRVPSRGTAEELPGAWLYGGHWSKHFGHFLLEVITSLWPEPGTVQPHGLLFHRSFRGGLPKNTDAPAPPALSSWQRDMLSFAGYGDLPVLTVQRRRTRVEELTVPSRPLSLRQWAQPEATAVWHRMAAAVPPTEGPQRVFLSRSAFNASATGWHVRSSPDWDERVEREVVRHGFTVVTPEVLSIAEQIALVRSASVLAGASGSALHLSAFAEPGTRVLEIGDRRSHGAAQPSQQMVDAARGHLTAFVDHGDLAGLTAVLTSLEG